MPMIADIGHAMASYGNTDCMAVLKYQLYEIDEMTYLGGKIASFSPNMLSSLPRKVDILAQTCCIPFIAHNYLFLFSLLKKKTV